MNENAADANAPNRAGDASPLDPSIWVDVHAPIMYRYALARVRSPEIAEDLVQEAFLAALKARGRFQGRSSERTWLVGILRNKIVDYYRKRNRGPAETELGGHEDWLAEFFDERGAWKAPPNPAAVDPGALAEREEFWAVFDDCLDHLPARAREAFVRRVMEDEDTASICKQMELTSTNLYVILFRARTRMRRCLTLQWFKGTEHQAQ